MHEGRDGIDARHDTGRHDSATESASAYPHDVARVLSYLANLIDGSIALRGVGNDTRVSPRGTSSGPPSSSPPSPATSAPCPASSPASPSPTSSANTSPSPSSAKTWTNPCAWSVSSSATAGSFVPYELSAAFPPGTLAGPPLAVTFETDYGDRLRVRVWARSLDADLAGAWLDDLIARGRTSANPFRGRIIRASARSALWFSIDDITPTMRDDVVLDRRVWTEVDRSITSLVARRSTHPPPDSPPTADSFLLGIGERAPARPPCAAPSPPSSPAMSQ